MFNWYRIFREKITQLVESDEIMTDAEFARRVTDDFIVMMQSKIDAQMSQEHKINV